MDSAVTKAISTAALLALACCIPAFGQTTQPVIFVDVENLVTYYNDLTDQPKLVPNPGITPIAVADMWGVFGFTISIGDIVAVNGQPAKGTVAVRAQILNLVPADAIREANGPSVVAVADTMRAAIQTGTIEVLKTDGSAVGIFTIIGMGGMPPVGAPASITSFNFAIVGGTGAFVGARGQAGNAAPPAGAIAVRNASMAENPANRRINGGGQRRYALQVIPQSLPQIVTGAGGPVVYHDDFSPVTSANPAKTGEVLVVQATGLGPTLPRTEPGQAFPADGTREVNSPVEVSVNGKPAEVINKSGWPGMVDTYRVDFRVPDGVAAGSGSVQLTAAWIAGPASNIPIQ